LFNSNNFKIYTMDNECHGIFDQAFAKDPYYLPSDIALPSSVQSFCLCDKESKIPIASFYCFPYVAKGRWIKDRILRITRPLILKSHEKLNTDVVTTLLQEIYEIGKRAGVNIIEAEIYEEINSKIFFPSTSCAVNTYNTLEWIKTFESFGFVRSKTMQCFELNLDELNEYKDPYLSKINIRKYQSNDEEDKKLYLNLWSQSKDCPYNLVNNGFWYTNVFEWPRIFYSEISHILNKDDYILFAEKNGEVVGFIHWWPNLYPLLIEGGRKAIFGTEDLINNSLAKIDEGKVFKIIVSKKAKNDKDLIEKSLINEAAKIMKNKFKFKRCQIGNISEEKQSMLSFIQENGGKKVHEYWVIRNKSFARLG